jgi:hypothetical protein
LTKPCFASKRVSGSRSTKIEEWIRGVGDEVAEDGIEVQHLGEPSIDAAEEQTRKPGLVLVARIERGLSEPHLDFSGDGCGELGRGRGVGHEQIGFFPCEYPHHVAAVPLGGVGQDHGALCLP